MQNLWIEGRSWLYTRILQCEPPLGFPLEEFEGLSHLLEGEFNLLFISFRPGLASCPMSTDGDCDFLAAGSAL